MIHVNIRRSFQTKNNSHRKNMGIILSNSFGFSQNQVMESLEHPMKRGAPITAEYLGGAVTCDAYHMTDPRSDGLGVSMCIQKCLEDAGVSHEEVTAFDVSIHLVVSNILLKLC